MSTTTVPGSPKTLPEHPVPQRIPLYPPRWKRVAVPRGVLPATLAAGIAGAIALPLGQPGIGWLLAVLVSGAAIYLVDRGARRTSPAAEGSGGDVNVDEGGTGSSEKPSRAEDSEEGSETKHQEANFSSEVRIWRDIAAADPGTGAGAADDGGAEAGVAAGDGGGVGADGGVGAGAAPEAGAGVEATGEVAARASVVGAPASTVDPEGAENVGRQPYRGRLWWVALTVVLLSVGTWRASGWLFAWCVAAALVTGSLAMVGRRSVFGAWFDAIAVPWTALTVPPWLLRAASSRDASSGARVRIGISLAVTAGLLLVFVPLLAGADAIFANLLDAVVPDLDAESVTQGVVAFVAVAGVTAGSLYLLAGPPLPARDEEPSARGIRWRPLEWALPVGAVTAVFAVFVAVQLAALFGGDDYVQRTAGLTYAEHARQGFWQLSAVTILTLAVIAAVLRWGAQEHGTDRAWMRALLGAVTVLSLVIIASALYRMWTYQQAYGFTVLRLLVEVGEVWIGLVYVLVLAGLIRLRRRWLPRAVIGTAAVTLLALAVVNPERLIADRNIDRWESGKNIDTAYLSGLSADVAPAADRLPEPWRSRILDPVRKHSHESGWQTWNLSRHRLR
ncbi:hypothetical protein BJY24_006249 [Nocardia transvalensis]|uniref:DUF4173 domain-containing protein n=1 Tax=Nocardia transvalensis TaxID=37333 RepID=A0A7W9PJS3_9NOCA|nr:DUF4173 domain-containing protein [Nocardia transvalensis]MBB5917337.1 hypothetical protein [Nocardia transvalensis]